MSTDWTDIIENEEIKFDPSKIDIPFLQGLFAGLTEEQAQKIHAQFEKAFEATEKKQAVLNVLNTVVAIAKAGVKGYATISGIPL